MEDPDSIWARFKQPAEEPAHCNLFRHFTVTAIKKGAYKRPAHRHVPAGGCGDLGSRAPADLGGLPLNLLLQAVHLVFETQLEFLQPHFFQFFVVGEKSFFGERFEALGVLRVLLNQLLELNMAGQELVSWSQHPCQTSCCLLQHGYKLAHWPVGVQ
jgi:hypothetical protein